MEDHAPEGHVAVATVFIAGREKGIVISRVETRRDDFEWVFLIEPAGDGGAAHPDDRVLFVREDTVLRVELTYERRPHAFGFSYGELPADG